MVENMTMLMSPFSGKLTNVVRLSVSSRCANRLGSKPPLLMRHPCTTAAPVFYCVPYLKTASLSVTPTG